MLDWSSQVAGGRFPGRVKVESVAELYTRIYIPSGPGLAPIPGLGSNVWPGPARPPPQTLLRQTGSARNMLQCGICVTVLLLVRLAGGLSKYFSAGGYSLLVKVCLARIPRQSGGNISYNRQFSP